MREVPPWLQFIQVIMYCIITVVFVFDVGPEESFQYSEGGLHLLNHALPCLKAEPLTHLKEFNGFHWVSWWLLLSNYGLKVLLFWEKIKNKYPCISFLFWQTKWYLLYWHKLYQQLQSKYVFISLQFIFLSILMLGVSVIQEKI